MQNDSEINLNSPSHIFVGKLNELIIKTNTILKKIFCSNICQNCTNCIKIKNNLHENILWLKSEKQYTIDQIDLVLDKISFINNDQFFVVFEEADLLTTASSNRLLKSIEEPSAGYYFIFLTRRANSILPTIASRSIVKNFYINNLDQFINLDLANCFINFNYDPSEFLKIIEKSNITEFESTQLLDQLINHWSEKCKKYLIGNNTRKYSESERILHILNEEFTNPIMPGSSKIFWRNLFIKLNVV